MEQPRPRCRSRAITSRPAQRCCGTFATGVTASEYVQRFRVSKACELLQFGHESVEEIAWRSGYEDAEAFRKLFQRYLGLTPGDYRKRFGAF